MKITPNNLMTRNAMMAVIQAAMTGGVLFFLYRYLLKAIGSEQVGVWSIVLATVSASRISEMGLTGSAVKFTAKYIALGKKSKAAEVIQTTYLTVSIVLICVLAGCYPFVSWVMSKLIAGPQISVARAILPIGMLSVWIGVISGVFLAGLDGCQRIDLRAFVSIIAGFLFLTLTWILVPKYGLIGLAWAQIGQGMFMLLCGRIMLQYELPSLRWLPFGWHYSHFREMFLYGVNFQIVSICSMLFEPTTKALMAMFGGLTATAYYEMANRMVVQFRSLLVSANQVIVPRIAMLQESEPGQIQNTYLESYRIVFFFALPLFAGLAAITPLISELWLGRYEPRFVSYTLLLLAGWWVNTYTGPTYFVNLGTGVLCWNTLGHVAIGVLNIVLGYFLGLCLGGGGVALGYVLALASGSSLIIVKYHLDNHIPFRMLLPSESKQLMIACFAGLLAVWIVIYYFGFEHKGVAKTALSSMMFILAVSPAVWVHPLRKKIDSHITSTLMRQTRKE